MKTKQDIAENWFPRYTSMPLSLLEDCVLLTNFSQYVNLFSNRFNAKIYGEDRAMQSCSANGITIINFGMGSPTAATVMDLLSAKKDLRAVLFLGKCGGLKEEHTVGDFILPIGAVRQDGTSDNFLPKEVPALPHFALQKAVSTAIREAGLDYYQGVVVTTNRRVWEHDEEYKHYLRHIRADAIDMETATLFAVGFHNKIPTGALLLVSDEPMDPEGVKTEVSDKKVSSNFVNTHLDLGIQSLRMVIEHHQTLKNLKAFS
jgi:AMP nucleosidase